MGDLQRLMDDIEADARVNTRDIHWLHLLLKVADGRHSRAECGEFWLKTCDGDLARCKEEIKRLQTEMNEMLLQWYVGAALASKEPKGMK